MAYLPHEIQQKPDKEHLQEERHSTQDKISCECQSLAIEGMGNLDEVLTAQKEFVLLGK